MKPSPRKSQGCLPAIVILVTAYSVAIIFTVLLYTALYK